MGGSRSKNLGSRCSLHISFFLGLGSDGRAAAKKLGSHFLPFIFLLGSWVGWVIRGQETRLSLSSLHISFFLDYGSDGWAAAKKLGSYWAPVEFSSYFFLSGLLGRMDESRSRSWARILDSWVGWVGPRQRSWAPIGLPSYFLSGLLGRMGGPRLRRPDGWAAAKKLGSHSAPFIFLFWAPGSDGWVARWAPFIFPLLGRIALEIFEYVICVTAAKKGACSM
ncbi:hypothetical protein AK812_SmicGene2661 [Symbiodinium microadriaticum]|uniref:Uncharacterized protein n=1 Tax=Symbiodinium microadriaticum TaxID=2951 RepID=A0A1Q9F0L2_SYMMI|nr:hypothetical protein AK812_SmicGene2661 [Symbiodinium microadriaticum]